MILPFMVHPRNHPVRRNINFRTQAHHHRRISMEGGTLLWIWAGSCRQCRPAPWTSWSRRPRLRWSRKWPRSSCLCTCRSSLTPPAVILSLCWGKPESIYLALQEKFSCIYRFTSVRIICMRSMLSLHCSVLPVFALVSSESCTLHVWPLGDPKSDWAWGS